MLDFLLFIEDQDKEDIKIEQFKSTILNAFPGVEMYKKLYHPDEEEEGFIEVAPQDYEDIRDILDVINEVHKATESEIPHG